MRAERATGSPGEESSGFTLVELLIVVVVLGVLAAVVVFDLGGVSASATVASCRADVHIVATAVRAYEAQNASAPTTADLTASTDPYLSSFPSSDSFTISLSHGVVEVAAPSGSPPVPASSPRACAGLASHSGGTTTTSTTTTTTTVASPVTVVASTSGGGTSHDRLNLTFHARVTSWTVSITVSARAGESYRAMSPTGRQYGPHHSTPGGTITYSWTFVSSRPLQPGPLWLNAAFSAPARGRGSHPFAVDSYSWSAVASGTTTSGAGHF